MTTLRIYEDDELLNKTAVPETVRVRNVFEEKALYDFYTANCHDKNEAPKCTLNYTLDETAVAFREEILRRNIKKTTILNFQSLNLGTNSLAILAKLLNDKKVLPLPN